MGLNSPYCLKRKDERNTKHRDINPPGVALWTSSVEAEAPRGDQVCLRHSGEARSVGLTVKDSKDLWSHSRRHYLPVPGQVEDGLGPQRRVIWAKQVPVHSSQEATVGKPHPHLQLNIQHLEMDLLEISGLPGPQGTWFLWFILTASAEMNLDTPARSLTNASLLLRTGLPHRVKCGLLTKKRVKIVFFP